MDKVEPDKLSWLKDLPKPSAQSKEGFQARFDFNGMLVARDADVPVREGLHHHGDEQEVSGGGSERGNVVDLGGGGGQELKPLARDLSCSF